MTSPARSVPPVRDLLGYGNQWPAVQWPGGARVAVSFVVNFEEGAELSMTDGDDRNESIYEVIDGQPVPDACIDSHFEYGTRVGYWRIDEAFDRFGARYTLSACGRAVQRSPWLARHAADRGHEVSGHGWRWEKSTGMTQDQERRAIARTGEAIREATGRWPVGWHSRSSSTPNTRSLLVEQGFLYDSNAYNDDTPYFVPVGERRHLVLPYAFDTNDMQFQNTQRFATGREFAEYVCDAYDLLWREGATRPRMLSVGLHLRMMGRAARMVALERILQHMQDKGGAWIATREQIARHWIEHAATD